MLYKVPIVLFNYSNRLKPHIIHYKCVQNALWCVIYVHNVL